MAKIRTRTQKKSRCVDIVISNDEDEELYNLTIWDCGLLSINGDNIKEDKPLHSVSGGKYMGMWLDIEN